MKQKTFFIVFEGLSFGEKEKFDKKQHTQALKNTLCGLLVAFVDFCILLFLKLICDMYLMLLYVVSLLISTIKSQSSYTENTIYRRYQEPKIYYLLSKNGLPSTKSFSSCSIPTICPVTTSDQHKYISLGSYKRQS